MQQGTPGESTSACMWEHSRGRGTEVLSGADPPGTASARALRQPRATAAPPVLAPPAALNASSEPPRSRNPSGLALCH